MYIIAADRPDMIAQDVRDQIGTLSEREIFDEEYADSTKGARRMPPQPRHYDYHFPEQPHAVGAMLVGISLGLAIATVLWRWVQS